MSRWRFDREGTWVYPSIRVTASAGDVIDASYQIDAFWTEVDPSTPATIPPPSAVLPPYSEVPEGAFLVYSQAANNWIPSTVAPFDALGRVNEEGLPLRLTADQMDGRYAAVADLDALTASKDQPDGIAGLDGSGKLADAVVPTRLSQTALDTAYGTTDAATQAQVDALQASVDGLDANQTSLMQTAASVEELTFSQYLPCAVLSGAVTVSTGAAHLVHIWQAPFACKISQLSLVSETQSIAANDTNYLSTSLSKRLADGTTTSVIVSKTTQVTGGEALTVRKPWKFDGAAWDETNRVLAAGDMIYLGLDGIGTTVLTYPLLVVGRYTPL